MGRRIAALGVSLVLVAVISDAQFMETPEPVLGFTSDLEGDVTRITERREKPERFNSFTERLDYIHENMQLNLHQHVERVDTMMLTNKMDAVAVPHSRFRLAPFVRIEREQGTDFSFNPDFEAEIDLPNLERRWKVFIESSRGDELPGIDRSEKDQSAQIGISSITKNFKSAAGVKMRWPPIAFVRTEVHADWSTGHTVARPRLRLFYETDNGYGALTDLTMHRWFGARTRMYGQTVSAARYASKGTEGVDFEQSLKLGFVQETLEDGHTWRSVVRAQDLARGHILRYSLFGNAQDGYNVLERHRLTYTYRQPLYKKWIYLEVAPGLQFANENNWDTEYVLTAGLDMLFWGSYER
jgi:hypothetical protein